jgi:hypothetical protein
MDNPSTIPHAHFPAHGPIACRRCFTDVAPQKDLGPWRVINDPGAWGSAEPEILVLGFSKGFTQAALARSGRFEDIPFAKMRPRLTEVLRAVGVLGSAEAVDARMVASERRLAFGSLVRCSLSRINEKTGKHECTGPIMTRAFTEAEAAPIVRRCAETHLQHLPPSVGLVLMLGTGDAYISRCRDVIRRLHGSRFAPINAVAYRTGSTVWAHVSHPSGLNGYHPAWMRGDPTEKQGLKRQLAMQAVAASWSRVEAA